MSTRSKNEAAALQTLERALSLRERRLLRSLTSPAKIQTFLDSIPYSAESRDRCPLSVLRDRKAHCLDGALFAAAALRCLGRPPIVVDLWAWRDDDHVLALFKEDGRFGAVAKSNYVGLRYRDPIYLSLRELVMSYFEDFYNIEGFKSLRSYTRPLNLAALDPTRWMVSEDQLHVIVERLRQRKTTRLMTRRMVAGLRPMDRRSYRAGMQGTDLAGVYRPPQRRR
jgi:hypothetical protein